MSMNVFDRMNRKKDPLENNKGRDLGVNHSSKWRCTKFTNESCLQMPLIQRILKWPVESMTMNGTEEWLMPSNAVDSTNLKMIHSNDNRGPRDHWWRQDKLRLTVCDSEVTQRQRRRRKDQSRPNVIDWTNPERIHSISDSRQERGRKSCLRMSLTERNRKPSVRWTTEAKWS